MAGMVAIGVDTHRDEHVAVALDEVGGLLGSVAIAAQASGYGLLWEWASELGEPLFSVEGTGSYGAGLTAFLVAAGAPVFECERPRRRERRQGKSDLIDATLAARRLLSGERLARPRGGGVRDDLRLLLVQRRARSRPAPTRSTSCMGSRSPCRDLRRRLRDLRGIRLAEAAARLRPRQRESTTQVAVLQAIGRRALQLNSEIAAVDERLEQITPISCPTCAPSAASAPSAPLSSSSRAATPAGCAAKPRSLPWPAPAPSRPPAASPTTPSQPRRRPPTQPRPPRDRAQPRPTPRTYRRLLPTTPHTGQDPTRSAPLRQTTTRPLLPQTTTDITKPSLDTIEASGRRGHRFSLLRLELHQVPSFASVVAVAFFARTCRMPVVFPASVPVLIWSAVVDDQVPLVHVPLTVETHHS